MHAHSHPAAAAPLLFALTILSQPAITWGAGPVFVSTPSELYGAVNNPLNAGAVVMLAPGTYALDPSYANGGRLELQPGMTLRGHEGDPAAVVIDASALPVTSYQTAGITTGAIRMGFGANAVESLTVAGATKGAANIETDLYSAAYPDAIVRITHVVSTGAQRGIDVRNVGAVQAGRAIDAYLANNVITGNVLGEGVGLRIVNTNGASGTTIDVTLQGNDVSGNLAGVVVDNLTFPSTPTAPVSTVGNTITIRSTANRYRFNGTGAVLSGAISRFGHPTNANHVTFDGHGDSFTDNTGAISAVGPFAGGGIVAYGAINGGTLANPANHNAVLITLTGSQLARNQNADVITVGAESLDHTTLPGTDNHVTVLLQGSSVKATAATPVPSDPPYPSGGNSAVVVQ